MALMKLKSTPVLLIEDDISKNIKPVLVELTHQEENITMFCYEQPKHLWENVFKNSSNIKYCEEVDSNDMKKFISTKCCIIVDSVNQMALNLGWNECLKRLQSLKNNINVERLILVLHKDCLSQYSKIQVHLRHIANAVVSYETDDNCRVSICIKKNNKIVRSVERLSYDMKTSTLNLVPVEKAITKHEEIEKPLPGKLTTFKIETDQTEKIEKYKLKLPYMNKINEGESKVHYEPDAVDDWDEEDPDEDLDI